MQNQEIVKIIENLKGRRDYEKKRAVMGMHGRSGQHIVIDFEKSRIVVTNALYEDFNYKKIVYDPIKKGK